MVCPHCGHQAGNLDLFCTQCGCDLQDERLRIKLDQAEAEIRFGDDRTLYAAQPDAPYDAPRQPYAPGGGQQPYAPYARQPYDPYDADATRFAPDAAPAPVPAAGERKGSVWSVLLIVTGVFLVAVLTVVLLRLLTGRGSETETVVESPAPLAVETAAPTPEAAGYAAPSPESIPVVTAAPTPTPAPAPTPTPEPDYLLPESNTRYLSNADLAGLGHEQLCFARNEIFARHGRLFNTPQIAAYFQAKSWYHGTIPADKFDNSVLNAYERANVELIAAYEKQMYGGSYY